MDSATNPEFIHVPSQEELNKKKLVVTIITVIVLIPVIYAIIQFAMYKKEEMRVAAEVAEAQRIFDSIPTEFAHFSYTDATTSAEITNMYYPAEKIKRLEKNRDFEAQVNAIIPARDIKNVHLEWAKQKDAQMYRVFVLPLGYTNDSFASSNSAIQTSNLYSVVPVKAYQDNIVVVCVINKEKECESHSQDILIPQDQKAQFKISLLETGNLLWDSIPHTLKYNVFSRNSKLDYYGSAVQSVATTSARISPNSTEDTYFTVQACNTEMCVSSNEVMVEN